MLYDIYYMSCWPTIPESLYIGGRKATECYIAPYLRYHELSKINILAKWTSLIYVPWSATKKPIPV